MANKKKPGYSLPRELKLRNGTLRPCRENKNSPQFEKGTPEMPEWMDKEARQTYETLSGILNDQSVLTKADGMALSLLADNFQMYLEARRDIKENGLLIDHKMDNGTNTRKKNPSVDIAFKAHSKIMAGLREFGLTPASRHKVNNGQDESGDEDIRDLLN